MAALDAVTSSFAGQTAASAAASPTVSDEVLISEGDMVGRTAAELGALHFARDRDYLQRED
jgi:hypothetical protein